MGVKNRAACIRNKYFKENKYSYRSEGLAKGVLMRGESGGGRSGGGGAIGPKRAHGRQPLALRRRWFGGQRVGVVCLVGSGRSVAGGPYVGAAARAPWPAARLRPRG